MAGARVWQCSLPALQCPGGHVPSRVSLPSSRLRAGLAHGSISSAISQCLAGPLGGAARATKVPASPPEVPTVQRRAPPIWAQLPSVHSFIQRHDKSSTPPASLLSSDSPPSHLISLKLTLLPLFHPDFLLRPIVEVESPVGLHFASSQNEW